MKGESVFQDRNRLSSGTVQILWERLGQVDSEHNENFNPFRKFASAQKFKSE